MKKTQINIKQMMIKLRAYSYLVSLVFIVFSCNSSDYKNTAEKRAKVILNNLPDILKRIGSIEEKYKLDFARNIRYRIINGSRDTLFRDIIYDNSLQKVFNDFALSEISLEKNSRCSTNSKYSEIIFFDRDNNTTYHYYKCNYPFNYVNESDNSLAYSKIINNYFEVVYEK